MHGGGCCGRAAAVEHQVADAPRPAAHRDQQHQSEAQPLLAPSPPEARAQVATPPSAGPTSRSPQQYSPYGQQASHVHASPAAASPPAYAMYNAAGGAGRGFEPDLDYPYSPSEGGASGGPPGPRGRQVTMLAPVAAPVAGTPPQLMQRLPGQPSEGGAPGGTTAVLHQGPSLGAADAGPAHTIHTVNRDSSVIVQQAHAPQNAAQAALSSPGDAAQSVVPGPRLEDDVSAAGAATAAATQAQYMAQQQRERERLGLPPGVPMMAGQPAAVQDYLARMNLATRTAAVAGSDLGPSMATATPAAGYGGGVVYA